MIQIASSLSRGVFVLFKGCVMGFVRRNKMKDNAFRSIVIKGAKWIKEANWATERLCQGSALQPSTFAPRSRWALPSRVEGKAKTGREYI